MVNRTGLGSGYFQHIDQQLSQAVTRERFISAQTALANNLSGVSDEFNPNLYTANLNAMRNMEVGGMSNPSDYANFIASLPPFMTNGTQFSSRTGARGQGGNDGRLSFFGGDGADAWQYFLQNSGVFDKGGNRIHDWNDGPYFMPDGTRVTGNNNNVYNFYFGNSRMNCQYGPNGWSMNPSNDGQESYQQFINSMYGGGGSSGWNQGPSMPMNNPQYVEMLYQELMMVMMAYERELAKDGRSPHHSGEHHRIDGGGRTSGGNEVPPAGSGKGRTSGGNEVPPAGSGRGRTSGGNDVPAAGSGGSGTSGGDDVPPAGSGGAGTSGGNDVPRSRATEVRASGQKVVEMDATVRNQQSLSQTVQARRTRF